MKWRGCLFALVASLSVVARGAEPETLDRQIPLMVEVKVEFVAYEMDHVDRLASSGSLSAASLLALWREGGARLLYAPLCVTRSGQEAIVKSVVEYIYPTEYEVSPPAGTNTVQGTVASGLVEPSGFEMREAGSILQFIPEIAGDLRTINIILNPQVIYPPAWKNYGRVESDAESRQTPLPMEQPFFPVQSVSTSVTVADGVTVLIGGGMNHLASNKTVYVFLTSRLLDSEGNSIRAEARTGEGGP